MAGMQQLGALSLDKPQPYVKPRVKQDKAAWQVSGKGFYDDKDKLWYPGQALYFNGEPNLDLIPLNKIAYDKQQEFLDKLDALGMKRAKKDNKEYVALPRMQWSDDGVVDDLPTPEFVMGSRKEGVNEAIR